MIQSNNINVRNLIDKRSLFDGAIPAGTLTRVINAKNFNIVRVTVKVNIASSTLRVFFKDAFDNGLKVYNSRGVALPNSMLLNRVGSYTFLIDPEDLLDVHVQVAQTGSGGNLTISYSLLSGILPLESSETPAGSIRFKDGVNPPRSESINIEGLRYAIIEISVYANPSLSSNFFLPIKLADGTTVYPEIRDLKTNELISGNNSITRLSKSRLAYADLGKLDGISMEIAGTSSDSVSASVSLVSFSKTNPFNDDTGKNSTPDILFEGDNYKFERTSAYVDTWNGLIANFTATTVSLSDDVSNPDQQVLDVSSVTTAEGSTIQSVSLIPYDPLMQQTRRATRVMIVLSNGEIYINRHNGGNINTWGKSKFWECKETNRKIPTKNLSEVGQYHRYDLTMAPDRYTRNATVVQSTRFLEYQEKPNFNFLGALCRTKKMVVFGNYLTDGSRVGIWATTDGGENWILQYDFINTNISLSNNVNTSGFVAYSGGLSLKKITVLNPSLTDKDPAIWFQYSDLPLTSISVGAQAVVTSTSHGLVTGDLVLFTGTPQNDAWSSLVCESFSATEFKTIIYVAEVINANSFRLKEYLGSYDRTLSARHVHSVNEHVGGVIASTGEEYPNGWFLYLSQRLKDGGYVVDAFRLQKADTYRLNSAQEGIQRACGVLMNNLSDPDIIFNCDTSWPNLGDLKVDGRTGGLPPRPVNGIWKGKLSKIDDWSGGFEPIADIPEPAIWMYNNGDIIVAYFQMGGNAVSTDWGETWDYFPEGTSIVNGIRNNSIVIGNGYEFKWK